MSGIVSDNLGRSSGLVKSAGGGGKVLQVVTNTLTAPATTTAQDATFADTGLSAAITPATTSSRILILVAIGAVGRSVANRQAAFRLDRSGTSIGIGDEAGSRGRVSFGLAMAHIDRFSPASFTWLDSPSSTSSLTYKVEFSGAGGETQTINAEDSPGTDNTDQPNSRSASSLTLIEIGA